MSSARLRGPAEVAEDEAGPALAATYARLRAASGVDFVPTIYRMLGVHEGYLAAATDALAGLLASDAAEQFCVQARRQPSRAASRLPAGSISLGASEGEVDALLERYARANPRSLLFARALLPAGPTDPGDVMGPREVGDTPLDASDPESILADVLDCHGGFVQPGAWRELAAYPEVLAQAWRAVRPLSDVPAFQETRGCIVAMATEIVGGLTPPDPLELGLSPEEVRSIQAILTWFTRGIAAMIVEVEYLRRIAHA